MKNQPKNPPAKYKILYSAVVLDYESKQAVFKAVSHLKKSGWFPKGDHMTICFGKGLPAHLKKDLGKEVGLTVTHVGKYENKVIAVKVEGYESRNKNPHVTCWVNHYKGGKPVDSNKITDWQPLAKQFTIRGKVAEVEFIKAG